MDSDVNGDAPGTYTWNFPICPHRVSVDLSVIRALQHDVSSTPAAQQGLLYGEARPGATDIEGWEPLAELGEKEFARALEKARRPVVGYYRIRAGCAFI